MALITRLYTQKDEIALLKCGASFKSEKGQDPLDNISVFKDIVNPSLSFTATPRQLADKMWRLKKKYFRTSEKRGSNPFFSKDHDAKVFKLSKKIWKNSLAAAACDENEQVDVVNENDNGKMNGNVKDRVEEFRLLHPLLCASIELEAKNASSLLSSKDYLERAIKGISQDKAIELEKDWKDFVVMEHQAYVERTKLFLKQTKALNDVISSSVGK
ncbi:STOREKEEPER protein-like [Apium graveolens]|uniref:STOREKEEPER protein-like n=1 Tax=Apium graveolens TaxID=4045 RepID=UPI003D79ADF9